MNGAKTLHKSLLKKHKASQISRPASEPDWLQRAISSNGLASHFCHFSTFAVLIQDYKEMLASILGADNTGLLTQVNIIPSSLQDHG